MKYLVILFTLAVPLSSCQRYLLISLPKGADVPIQGKQLSVGDSAGHFSVYRIDDTYREFNHYNAVYQLLKQADDTSLGLGMVHTQSTRIYRKKMNKALRKKDHVKTLAKK